MCILYTAKNYNVTKNSKTRTFKKLLTFKFA